MLIDMRVSAYEHGGYGIDLRSFQRNLIESIKNLIITAEDVTEAGFASFSNDDSIICDRAFIRSPMKLFLRQILFSKRVRNVAKGVIFCIIIMTGIANFSSD